MIKISQRHDIIAVAYEGDNNLYFYAYEKGKILGFLYFGTSRIVKFKNAYLPHKTIHRVIGVEFIPNKKAMFVLLSD